MKILFFIGAIPLLGFFLGTPHLGTLQELEASSVYFPSELNPKYEKLFSPCVGRSLPAFRFRMEDLDPARIRSVFARLKERSEMEGKARAQSIRCLRKIPLTDSQIQALDSGLESLFRMERTLFFIYTRYLDNATGINRSRNETFLKSRYDLMVVIQTKTKDWVLGNRGEDDSKLDRDFSHLYLSVLRTYYDFYTELDPITRQKLLDR